ncbi:MAG TPA: hypothetical protein VGG39_19235 [Polyangiaceae bacterium]|jgi:hypothetical protein
MGAARRPASLVLLAACAAALATLAVGCDTILGIQEKDFTAEGGTGDGGETADATGSGKDTGSTPQEGGAGADGSGADAPEDVTYASCGAAGSDGAVCAPVTYGAWSSCGYADTCANTASRTRPVMTPLCSAGACAPLTTTETDTAGCVRDTDGTSCGTNETCTGGACVCVPQCAGKNCGTDGCGGSCGACSGGNHVCSGGGQCTCTPTSGCVSGASVPGVCATDDGCGGPCTCNTANGESCVSGACCYDTTHYCDANAMCCSGSCNIGVSTCN